MVKGEVAPVHVMYECRMSRCTILLILNLGRSTSCPTHTTPEKPLALNGKQAGCAPPMALTFWTRKKSIA